MNNWHKNSLINLVNRYIRRKYNINNARSLQALIAFKLKEKKENN
jgi:hypothetical protein